MSPRERHAPQHGRHSRPVTTRRVARRTLAIVVLVAVLVGTGVTDRVVARGVPTPSGAGVPSDALAVTAVSPVSAESTAWYCAGGTAAQGGAPGTLVLTNAGSRPVSGTITVVPALATGASPTGPWSGGSAAPVTVPADGQLDVPEGQSGSSVEAAAVVLDAGGVSVAQAVSSPLGWSMAPCATGAGSHWYFAHGATAQAGGLLLNLFNPGATDAAVDVSMVSATAGSLAPAAYQGIDVPPGALVTENIGDHAADDPALATQVTSLSGTVVATELESVGASANGGLSITLGTPVPSTQWIFPQNVDGAGTTVAFRIFNPSSRAAVVSVAIGLSAGEAAEPLTMHVPAQTLSTLVAENETRIPSGVPYSLTFASPGTGIVVVRQVTAPPGPPAPVPEGGDVVGVPGPSTHWIVPAVAPPGTGASSVAVVDLGPAPATVHFTTPSGRPLAGQRAHRVEPGTPLVLTVAPGAPFGGLPFGVGANEPVAVELDGQPAAGPGVVVAPAFPRT